jgi:hypothetical protein
MSGSLTDASELAARLAWLGAWRRGALAGAAAVLAAGAAGLIDAVPAGVALAAAVALAGAVDRAAGTLLGSAVVEAPGLCAFARRRATRARARRRRRLVAWLRRTAAMRARGRHDVVPVERVRRARRELLALADEIEAAPGGDPRIWADVEALLRDAIDSPLLNEALPEDELAIALRSLLYRVATDPRARGRAAAGDRSVNDTAWSRDRRAPRLRWRHERHGDAWPPPRAAGDRRRARA